jgi:hypothetical protein
MCNRFPLCQHASLIMDRTGELGDRHCETVLPNHTCPYLFAGCKGCTHTSQLTHNDVPVKPIAQIGRYHRKTSFEIALTNVTLRGPGIELLYAHMQMPMLSQMLQNMVKAELVSQEWANQSLLNAATHMQRTLIYRRLCSYIEIRSEEDATDR